MQSIPENQVHACWLVADVAAWAQCSKKTAARWARSWAQRGDGVAFKVGQRWRFNPAAVRRLVGAGDTR
jgi:hypothetical protein